jgi:predicted extracellular nuclease
MQPALAGTVAYDMVGSASQNLVSYTNPWTNTFSSAGDGFQKYQRGVSSSIPFSVLDDSLSIFTGDSLGIIGEGNTDEFFGVTDTENGDNSGAVSATWVFDVGGAGPLQLSIDMGAMGDFEASDTFQWNYRFDGGPDQVAFASTVDEDGAFTYTLDGGASFTLNDPMLMNGTVLSNELATFSAPLSGSGSQLTITLTARTDGGSEAFAFQNLVVGPGTEPPPPPELEIWEIQGDGSSTPYSGQRVVSRDNAVTALADDGFFMQTPTARSDGDVDTSDGIFVYTATAPGVSVGDRVDVTGTPTEFFGFTEIEPDSVTVIGTGAIPAAVVFDANVPSPDPAFPSCAIEFECYEGMLVQITGGTVTGPNQRFNPDPLAEVFITAAPQRTFREPGIVYPAPDGLPEWDGNPEVFELDPNRLGLDNAVIPAGSVFDAIGVLGYEFGGYELWPTVLTVLPAPLPVPVRSPVANETTVGALNLFRLFDDIDDPDIEVRDPDTDEVIRTTGETVVSAAEYQRRLVKLSAYIRGPLAAPDVLAVSEVESLKVLQDLADRIASDDTDIAYTPYLEEGNDVGGIDVGFLVRDTVIVDEVTQLGRYQRLSFDGSLLNDRPPLLLEGRQVADGSDFPVAVIAIHSRSLGGIEGSDGERVRQKRYEQAQFVAAAAQAVQEENPDINLVIAGDFNAYEFSDGYVDVTGIMQGVFEPGDSLVCASNACENLVQPALSNVVATLPANERYSFIFTGSAQVLDHALISSGLEELVRDFAFARGNADAAVNLIEDETTPLRASDHDGLVLYLAKDSDGDGVTDDVDVCPATVIPESVPTVRLLPNNFALVDDDRLFDTAVINDKEPKAEFDIFDTAGCSCEQIIVEQELGNGHRKFGCSIGEMEDWVERYALP